MTAVELEAGQHIGSQPPCQPGACIVNQWVSLIQAHLLTRPIGLWATKKVPPILHQSRRDLLTRHAPGLTARASPAVQRSAR
jgi:hypothetical protein